MQIFDSDDKINAKNKRSFIQTFYLKIKFGKDIQNQNLTGSSFEMLEPLQFNSIFVVPFVVQKI